METTRIWPFSGSVRTSTGCRRYAVLEGCWDIVLSRLGHPCASLRTRRLGVRRLCGTGCQLFPDLLAISSREALVVLALRRLGGRRALMALRDAASQLPWWGLRPRCASPSLRPAGLGLS